MNPAKPPVQAPPAVRGLTPQIIAVDLDERAFLFPETRLLAQARFIALQGGDIAMEFIYAHNDSRLPPAQVRMRHEDAKDWCLRLVDVVYRAQSQNVITESIRISMTVVANGYILAIEEGGAQKSLYLSTHIIWRFCHALFRIVDIQSPILSN
jgi:hypothetical protein